MLHLLGQTLYAALLMLWETLWALTLGFGLSAFLQAFVRREQITKQFGQADLRSVSLATFLGAVSSSCSYAATATMRTVFKKGANLIPSLAFMFASTNLVLELGFVLFIFLGWRFVLAEGVGALVLIGLMWGLVRLTLPHGLESEARHQANEADEEGGHCCHGHQHREEDAGAATSQSFGARLHDSTSWSAMADALIMDVSMMWKEIAIGFLLAGFLMTAVPHDWWKTLFLSQDAPVALRIVENCVVGVIIAMASFVCSVGNIPLASLLWSGGISFGGVISFIYADLIIVPILVIYRKSYGLKAAAYISAVLFASMVGAGIIVDMLFSALHLVPTGSRPPSVMADATFHWNYTTWLDLVALAALAFLFLRVKFARQRGNHTDGQPDQTEHHHHMEPPSELNEHEHHHTHH